MTPRNIYFNTSKKFFWINTFKIENIGIQWKTNCWWNNCLSWMWYILLWNNNNKKILLAYFIIYSLIYCFTKGVSVLCLNRFLSFMAITGLSFYSHLSNNLCRIKWSWCTQMHSDLFNPLCVNVNDWKQPKVWTNSCSYIPHCWGRCCINCDWNK